MTDKAPIQTLTTEQWEELPRIRERWRAIGLATDPIDPVAARRALRALYRFAGLPEPRAIIVLPSPLACLTARETAMRCLDGDLTDNRRAVVSCTLQRHGPGQLGCAGSSQIGWPLSQQVIDRLWGDLFVELGRELWGGLEEQLRAQEHYHKTYMVGGHEAFWLAHHEFSEHIGVQHTEHTRGHFEAYKACVLNCGWIYPYDEIAFISDRPQEHHFDAQRRLHNATGMAVKYRDGWGACVWHGLRVPRHLIEERHKITPATIEAEKNVELRRAALEIFGFEKYLTARGAKLITADELHGHPRRLFEVEVAGAPVRIVEVINGSLEPDGTRRKFHLGAMPGDTPHDAIAASYGINRDVYREAVRT